MRYLILTCLIISFIVYFIGVIAIDGYEKRIVAKCVFEKEFVAQNRTFVCIEWIEKEKKYE